MGKSSIAPRPGDVSEEPVKGLGTGGAAGGFAHSGVSRGSAQLMGAKWVCGHSIAGTIEISGEVVHLDFYLRYSLLLNVVSEYLGQTRTARGWSEQLWPSILL